MRPRQGRGGAPTAGLVLSGGGARGVFQVGVYERLLEDPRFSRGPAVISGTSAGGINAALIAAGKSPREMLQFWNEIADYPPVTASPAFFDGAVRTLARLSEVKVMATLPESPSPVAVVGQARLMLHKEVDPAVEAERISKEMNRVSGEIAKFKAKLANASFVERAPAPVVEQERNRLAAAEETVAKLQDQLRKLRGQK